MGEFQEELAEAVETLDRRYSELKATARQRLGSLYNPSDYPSSLAGLFAIEFDFPSVEPPDYSNSSTPQLYEQECQRVQARFDEAVRLAEEAFTAELAKLVSHLTERLSGTRGRQAQDLPGFGRREPDRVLPAVPPAQRPLQRATRPAWWPTPSGSSAASSPRRCGTMPACGSTSPRR